MHIRLYRQDQVQLIVFFNKKRLIQKQYYFTWGAYNEQRTAFDGLNRLHGLKKTPFSQSSIRFSLNYSRSAPGPGQYRICGFAEDNLKKAIIDSNRKPAFGQSSERKFSIAKKDGSSFPGPANYKIVEKPFKPKNENFSSNFASTTKQRDVIYEVNY